MKTWWKEQVIYQIYPRSFNDSNGDGIGDIPGIIEKLDVLQDLGIELIWLSPVYKSPNYDNGYDISDYINIHPDYGTMNDMDNLIKEAKKRGIGIVMDLVINHTSVEHEWFEKSRNRIDPYTDYYIWQDGKDGELPNNWTTFFAEDAWEWDDVRKQYYLHLFAKQQPDLNWHNPLVVDEVKKILAFWLDKGIKGFRCDVINVIYKSSLDDGKKQFALKGLEHYLSQEGNHKILQELNRDVLRKYDCFTVGETVLVDPDMARDLCNPKRNELDMIFSFEHMEADQYLVKWFKRKFNKVKFFETLSKWQHELEWNANYFENHDQLRSVSRFGDDKKYWRESATTLATLLLSLKGTPFIYQGQEIGMTNHDYKSMKEIEDVESRNVNTFLQKRFIPPFIRWRMIKKSGRDNVRTPMQWSNQKNGGFTTGKPWLKVNKNYTAINLESQLQNDDSIWHYYKKMIILRKNTETLIYGDFEELLINKNVFAFARKDVHNRYTVICNLSNANQTVPLRGEILINNYNKKTFNGTLEPYESVILKG